MATIGYLRDSKNAQTLDRNLRQLHRQGISHASIIIGGDIMQVIDALACGDCLVVTSVTELSPQVARQQMLLKYIADKGITFRPLNRINTIPVVTPETFMDWLFRHLGIRFHGRNNSVTAIETQANTEQKTRITDDCLKSYYGLKETVETICERAQIQPRTLYDFLQKNNLPSRRNVKAKPKLNPLRHPYFPENLLGSRPDREKA